MRHDDVVDELLSYIGTKILRDEDVRDLNAQTPLLELGVLNSVDTARLIAHIQSAFGAKLPLSALVPDNFRDLDSLARAVMASAHPAEASNG